MKRHVIFLGVLLLIGASLAHSQEYWTVSRLGIYGTNYDIGRDNNGNVHIIWLDGEELYYGRIVNAAVVGKETIPRGGSSVHVKFTRPRLAVRPDGTSVHTSWIDYYGGGGRALKHAWRDSNGTWHNEDAWSNGGSNYYIAYPSVGADLSGIVHCIAQKWGPVWSTVYGRKVSGVWTWYTIETGSWRQQVAFTDKNGGFHATWRGLKQQGRYRYCPSGGNLANSSTIYIPIVPGTETPSMGDLFVADNGDVHNAFVSFNIGQVDYYVKRAASSSFGELSHPSNGAYHHCSVNEDYDPWPAIIADDSGHVVTAYGEMTNCSVDGFNRVTAAFYTDGVWTRATIADNAYITGFSKPAMTIVNNVGYLVWRSNTGQLHMATSDVDPTVTVTSPNGGEVWEAGSTHNITWSSAGSVGNVRIEYSTNNGSSWTSITSSTANDGSYSWTVTNVNSSQCKVRVSEASDGYPSDTSNAVFTIVPAASLIQLSLSRSQMNFGYVQGGSAPEDQSFTISISGAGAANWSVGTSTNWLDCSPSSGSSAAEVTVSIVPSGLNAGIHTAAISVTDLNATNSPQVVSVTLRVYEAGTSSTPFGRFDTPLEGSTVSGSVPVTGWALDDVGVENVNIFRKEGGSYYFVGSALFIEGARPDVEETYQSYPMNYRAGWGYMMLTYFLPNGGNGTYTLYAIANDKDGHQVTLGSTTFTCDNANAVKPFGAIDTPTQGGSASGDSFNNQGWVLTPMPNSIPVSGSTISVFVDGVSLGHPVYNNYRSDIAGLFPGYANSQGAAAYFYFDTTNFADGVHTIAWTAMDNAGNSDGIGSRYFSIQNGQGSRSAAQAVNTLFPRGIPRISSIPVDYSRPVDIVSGFDPHAVPFVQYPDDSGLITVEINELERIELRLDPGESSPSSSAVRLSGFQVVGNELKPLPIGSFLDTETRIFYWQTGPGFLGEYKLVFLVESEDQIYRKNVTIRVMPKFSKD